MLVVLQAQLVAVVVLVILFSKDNGGAAVRAFFQDGHRNYAFYLTPVAGFARTRMAKTAVPVVPGAITLPLLCRYFINAPENHQYSEHNKRPGTISATQG